MGNIAEDFKSYWEGVTGREYGISQTGDCLGIPRNADEMQGNFDYQDKFINFFIERGKKSYYVDKPNNGRIYCGLDELIGRIRDFYSTFNMDYRAAEDFYIRDSSDDILEEFEVYWRDATGGNVIRNELVNQGYLRIPKENQDKVIEFFNEKCGKNRLYLVRNYYDTSDEKCDLNRLIERVQYFYWILDQRENEAEDVYVKYAD